VLSALYVPPFGEYAEPSRMLELAQVAEEAGYAGFFIWDHVALRRGGTTPLLDPVVMLGALAQATRRIRLGAMVTPLARRRPWKVAKELTTLDQLSGGRIVCGAGLGGALAADFEAFGDDASPAGRAARLDEALAVLDPLLRGLAVDHRGRHYTLTDARIAPGCVQRPRMPIWVGAARPSLAGFRRAARWDGCFPLKIPQARGAGWQDWWLSPVEFAEVHALMQAWRAAATTPFDCVASGRTLGGEVDARATLAAYRAAGANWWFEWVPDEPGTWARTLAAVRRGPPSPATP
jgi:alkanesulfonate monooxygenase SsuD/methylene tetrahydromethanopterin reductase-like flavin-dependent oxidoreductase (luciferase family)